MSEVGNQELIPPISTNFVLRQIDTDETKPA